MSSLKSVEAQLSEFYDSEDAKLWLQTPHKLLDGKRPADLSAAGDVDVVLAVIDQLRTGAYV